MDKIEDLTAIDAHTFKDLLDRDSVCSIDVREAGEYAGGHIVGSIGLPLSQLNNGRTPFEKKNDR